MRTAISIAGLSLMALVVCNMASFAWAEDDPNRSANPMRAVARDHLSGFRRRPLFNPARAEPVVPETAPASTAPAVAPPPEPPPTLRLVGIINGARDLAIVRLDAGTKTSVLSTGDRLGTWIVTVMPTTLRLRSDQRSVEYALFAHAARPAGDPTPPVKGADAFPPTGDPEP